MVSKDCSVFYDLIGIIFLLEIFKKVKVYRVAHSSTYSSQEGHLCLISEMLRSKRKVYLHRNDKTNKMYIVFNTLKKKTFFSITARAASPGRISSGKLVRMVDQDVLQFQVSRTLMNFASTFASMTLCQFYSVRFRVRNIDTASQQKNKTNNFRNHNFSRDLR